MALSLSGYVAYNSSCNPCTSALHSPPSPCANHNWACVVSRSLCNVCIYTSVKSLSLCTAYALASAASLSLWSAWSLNSAIAHPCQRPDTCDTAALLSLQRDWTSTSHSRTLEHMPVPHPSLPIWPTLCMCYISLYLQHAYLSPQLLLSLLHQPHIPNYLL